MLSSEGKSTKEKHFVKKNLKKKIGCNRDCIGRPVEEQNNLEKPPISIFFYI